MAGIGGILLALSGEPWSLNAAGFASMAVLVAALAQAIEGPRPMLRAALSGLVFGTVVNAIALFSLVGLLQDFGHFPLALAWLVAALGWVAQALPYLAAGLLCERLVGRGLALWLVFPPSIAACLGLVPQLFPWHPGAPQGDFLWFAQMADLGGEPLIDLCLAFAGSSIWQLARADKSARRVPLIVGALSLLLPCGYGALRVNAIRELRAQAKPLRVGVVQSNVGIHLKHDPALTGPILKDLRTLTAALEAQGAELVVWAETAYPYRLLRSRREQPIDERRIVGDGVRGPVLFGAVTYQMLSGIEHPYNSAWLVERDGSLGDRVDKARLLAFGEYVPFWDWLPPLQKRFPSRGFEQGDNDVVRTQQGPLGILICYEDLFYSLARQVVDRGALALVNMTNDAWFGHSNEPLLHDMVAHLRAIETRRDFVRAVNTGVSSFTMATGELVTRTDTFVKASFVADMRLLDVRSPYVMLGDWVPPACLLALLIGVIAKRMRKLAIAPSS